MGWERPARNHRTPRNRQHRITLGNGLFGTTTLSKFITRHTRYTVLGRKPRGKALSLKQKKALLPTLEEKLTAQQQTEGQHQEGREKHLNNTEVLTLLHGGEVAGNLYPRLKATCKQWHKQLNKADMILLQQEVTREKETKRRERQEQKNEEKLRAKQAETPSTPETPITTATDNTKTTNQKLGGTWADVARGKQINPEPYLDATYSTYFEPQVGVNCVVHSFNMAMGYQVLTADTLLAHCYGEAENDTTKTMEDFYTDTEGFMTDALMTWMQKHGWNTRNPLNYQTISRVERPSRAPPTEATGAMPPNPTREQVLAYLPKNTTSFIIHPLHGVRHAACIRQNPHNHNEWLLLDSALSRPVNLDKPTKAPPGLYTQGWTNYHTARSKGNTPTWKDMQSTILTIAPRTLGTNPQMPDHFMQEFHTTTDDHQNERLVDAMDVDSPTAKTTEENVVEVSINTDSSSAPPTPLITTEKEPTTPPAPMDTNEGTENVPDLVEDRDWCMGNDGQVEDLVQILRQQGETMEDENTGSVTGIKGKCNV